MRLQSTTVTGCGSCACQCAAATVSLPAVTVNDVLLPDADLYADPVSLSTRVVGEILRQRAVAAGLLPDAAGTIAPPVDDAARRVMLAMLDPSEPLPPATEEECQTYYVANSHAYLQGQALHVRHILFAVAPEVNVHALLVQAERALVELSRPGVAPERFAELAAELSACPTRAIGGDLGWVGPHDCEPELANELFDQRHSRWGMGVHPRLIHTGHGFHIIEVLGRRKGRPIPYPQARASIAGDLAVQRQALARENSLRSLIAQARVQGIDVNTLLLEESLRFWCHD